jgi:mannan endo-1,4-beta-mannosidase
MSSTDRGRREGRGLREVHEPGRGVRRLMAALTIAALLAPTLVACSRSQDSGDADLPDAFPAAGSGRPPTTTVMPVDIRPLLHPSGKYWGAALPGAPRSLTAVDRFSDLVGKRPNILAYYLAWGDQFDVEPARNAWSSGSLPFISWEPFTTSVAEIASGGSDAYIIKFATRVRDANLPVAISFGHEMNGVWYPWGSQATEAAEFVAAWRHIHDLFIQAGAGNVIWVWCANVINPVPRVPLRPLYPGDPYVNWIGVVGYYTTAGAHTFKTLYGPTIAAVRRFTGKPFLISETAVEPGPDKVAQVGNLISGVRTHSDVIGFIWFDFRKRADWRLTAAPSGVSEFRRQISDTSFSVDVNQLA